MAEHGVEALSRAGIEARKSHIGSRGSNASILAIGLQQA